MKRRPTLTPKRINALVVMDATLARMRPPRRSELTVARKYIKQLARWARTGGSDVREG